MENEPLHLLQFSVKNYRSIKEGITLSMMASPKHDKENTFVSSVIKQPIFNSVVIYGANASGKSNIVRSLFMMQQMIVTDSNVFDERMELPATFALDDAHSDPNTFLEVIFEIGNRVFVYGFSVNVEEERINNEWLRFMEAGNSKFTVIFERQLDRVKINSNLLVKEHGISRLYTKLVSSKILFLTSVARIEVSMPTTAHTIVSAWKRFMVFNTATHDPMENVVNLLYGRPDLKEEILPLLRKADIAVADIKIEKNSNNNLSLKLGHRVKSTKVKTGKMVWFDIDEGESEGTRKFMSFSLPLLASLGTGSVVALDELGSGLHPNLIRYILNLFQNEKTNPYNAQIILTSHDTTPMKRLLARDQIYLARKNESDATELYTVSNFKGVRKNLTNLDDRYLKGDFGGVPEIDEED
jgi:AAA15 family ATPase/GTPase